ncbi:kelch repeat-containing protein [Toxoplasma gondii RUB]|uniref:Kelch repeat-containing protein n=1 Tax=Toxoplasma gondii RUB TaxID=935652 RepID=A0A086M3L4_TOXGO|nr:kelch repeat-containing protein [Toxoplasma gondii RUB]
MQLHATLCSSAGHWLLHFLFLFSSRCFAEKKQKLVCFALEQLQKDRTQTAPRRSTAPRKLEPSPDFESLHVPLRVQTHTCAKYKCSCVDHTHTYIHTYIHILIYIF